MAQLEDRNIQQAKTFMPGLGSGHIVVGDQEVQVVELHDCRVVTFAMIDRLHRRPHGTTKSSFRRNKHRLKEGEDYFYLTDSKSLSVLRSSGVLAPAANEITLISESGYLLLVKPFTDDLAWDVQRQLVAGYFRSTAIGRGASAALPDLKAVPLLCHELDRIGLAVSAIAAASLHYAQNPGKSWGALAERLNLPAESVSDSQDEMKERIWRSLCYLGGTDVPERIPRGALPRIWAMLNHMNRFYSGGRERIGGKRQVVDPRSLLVGPPKPVATLDGIALRQAFSKQTALHLESQLGNIAVSELLAYDRSFLRRLPNIGDKKVEEVELFFAGYGLRLGILPEKSAVP